MTQWYRIDDSQVLPVHEAEVLEKARGGKTRQGELLENQSVAWILSYIKKGEVQSLVKTKAYKSLESSSTGLTQEMEDLTIKGGSINLDEDSIMWDRSKSQHTRCNVCEPEITAYAPIPHSQAKLLERVMIGTCLRLFWPPSKRWFYGRVLKVEAEKSLRLW